MSADPPGSGIPCQGWIFKPLGDPASNAPDKRQHQLTYLMLGHATWRLNKLLPLCLGPRCVHASTALLLTPHWLDRGRMLVFQDSGIPNCHSRSANRHACRECEGHDPNGNADRHIQPLQQLPPYHQQGDPPPSPPFPHTHRPLRPFFGVSGLCSASRSAIRSTSGPDKRARPTADAAVADFIFHGHHMFTLIHMHV